MPAFFGGLIAGGGSLLGGLLGSNAQSSAASQEQQALLQALGFEKGVYNTAESNLNPFIKTGDNAVYSLASLFGLPGAPGQPNTGQGAATAFQNFTSTPAYQFPLQQGLLAANRGLAASGLTGSGAQAKALTQYGQGYASQGFNSYIGQLANLAGLGEQGATSLGNIGSNVGNTVSNLYGNYGAAGAAGTIGSANSLTQGLSGLLGALAGGSGSGGGFLGSSQVQGLLQSLGLGGSAYSGTGQNGNINQNWQ